VREYIQSMLFLPLIRSQAVQKLNIKKIYKNINIEFSAHDAFLE